MGISVVVQHHPSETLGSNFRTVLSECGADIVTIPAYEWIPEGEFRAPELDEVEAIVTLGGPMSANDPYPALEGEMSYLRNAAEAGIPVLAVCLGAQLLARALGGTVAPTGGYQFGLRKLWVSPEGHCDPAFGKIGTPLVPTLHGESFTIPPEASKLAEGFVMRRDGRYARINMAFRFNNAYGVQFEPQLTFDELKVWNRVFASDYRLMGPEFDPAEEARRNESEFERFTPVHEAQMADFFRELLAGSNR